LNRTLEPRGLRFVVILNEAARHQPAPRSEEFLLFSLTMSLGRSVTLSL
jgi:hypothetical protein